MGNACCSGGAPKDFRGPYLMTGDSKANMKQYGLINNKLVSIHTFPKVHSEDRGGIRCMSLGLLGEIMITKDDGGMITKWGVQRKLRIFHVTDIKITKIACIATDPHAQYFYHADKFGTIVQWDNTTKSIFNLWGKLSESPINTLYIPACHAEIHDEFCMVGRHVYFGNGAGQIKKYLTP